ncbi:ricin-type beta-trefoil lectin domain protein [Aquirhabdus parva]|uniref:Bulb-type lectin domain-containing protein n=1 Tax=Aquirhabdus parva TaxID=2283318 RepID=A0A345P8R4_9GAMM|nr:ricin-type beta-trefoil lectin domain protein [Aquirhabdus parva]AXI03673.1 hypothetical protein HYN46_13050 [Aquirhabdus parva]
MINHVVKKVGAIFAFLLCCSQGAFAATGTTPGNYIWWSFPSNVTAITDITYSVKVNQDPGPLANVFWSNQFDLAATTAAPTKLTGYMGMQSNGGSKRTFLISIWGPNVYKLGDAGSYCLNGTEGSPFVSCRTQAIYWQAGHTYQFHLVNEGDQWFGLTITDTTTNTSYKVGSIQTGRDAIDPKGNTVSWTEFFEWNSPLSTCTDQPYTKATFGMPIVNVNGVATSATVGSTSNGNSCSPDTTTNVDKVAGNVLVQNAIHNSIRGPILDAQGHCLINNNGTPALGTCSTFDSQQGWVLGSNGAIQNNHLCLTNTAGVPVASCTGDATQLWGFQNGQIVQKGTNLCLTAASPLVNVQNCSTLTTQQWSMPEIQSLNSTSWSCLNATPTSYANFLIKGMTLCPLDTMSSPSGNYHLNVLQNGNLTLTDSSNTSLWTTATSAKTPIRGFIQNDGNFGVADSADHALWSTAKTGYTGASVFLIQDDGNLVNYDLAVKFSSGFSDPTAGTSRTGGHVFQRGSKLISGQSVTSGNGKFALTMQASGNLVVTRLSDGFVAFQTKTLGAGNYAVLQNDGNFVVYSATNVPQWNSKTAGATSALLLLQDDGNLVLYSFTPKWSRF